MSAERPDLMERVAALALALPEATREDAGRHAGFKVRGRTFAWFQDDHHGDGMVTIVCKPPPGEAQMLLAAEPGRFLRPAYLGARGWVALRLDVGPVDWDEAWELLVDSYRTVAPKKLAAQAEALAPSRPA